MAFVPWSDAVDRGLGLVSTTLGHPLVDGYLEFVSAQRAPRRGDRMVRIEDGEPGLAARTIAVTSGQPSRIRWACSEIRG